MFCNLLTALFIIAKRQNQPNVHQGWMDKHDMVLPVTQ